MIENTTQLMDYIFNSEKDAVLTKILNEDEILQFCKTSIHPAILNNNKVKKDIKTDIIWTEDLYELIKRYKLIAHKYDLTINSIFPFKLNNLLTWLFDGGTVDIPSLFLYYKKEIDGICWYLHNSFLKQIKFVILFNKDGNHLYENDSFKIIQFYKFLIQQQKITKYDLFSYFPKKNYRKEFVKRLNELNLADTGNANSFFELINTGLLGNYDISKLIESTFGEQVDLKQDVITKEEINNILQQNETKKLLNDSKVIKELNQAIIDELQLTLFNVKTIKNKNLILYIFIDKDNLKRYYYEPFEFTFYISTNYNIVDNDYIVDYNPQIHIAYTMNDYNMVQKFKFALNDAYKKHMVKFLK
jgi:hypothetical protein